VKGGKDKDNDRKRTGYRKMSFVCASI
jgi:hypothetical protein